MSIVCYCGRPDCSVTSMARDACLTTLRAERDALKAQVANLEAELAQGVEACRAHVCLGAQEAKAERDALKAQVADLEERRFPVLDAGFSVPWRLVAPFEAQAERNHNQTLQRLAERGGLDPVELWAVMHGMGWKDRSKLPSQEAAKEWALSLVSIEARTEKAEAERDEAVAALRVAKRWAESGDDSIADAGEYVRSMAVVEAVLAKYPEEE